MSELKSTTASYDPNRLLDTVAAWLGIADDRALSRLIGLSPGIIRGLRAGRLPVRASILTLMADYAGKSVEELRSVLGDRRSRARMRPIMA